MRRLAARLILVKMAQNECLKEIIQGMSSGYTFEQAFSKLPARDKSPYPAQLRKFVSVLDENGLLRIGGRLDNAELAAQFKHPVVLPHRHWVAQLYIQKKHVEYCHFGPDLVFGSLQQDYSMWPVGGTQTVRFYIKNCEGCRLKAHSHWHRDRVT